MSIIDPNHPIRQDLSQVQRGHELPWFPLAWKVIDGLEESRDYGFAELAKIAGVKTDSADMVSALTFLSTCPSAIFDAHLCLYENGRRIPLEPYVESCLIVTPRTCSRRWLGKAFAAITWEQKPVSPPSSGTIRAWSRLNVGGTSM